MILEDGTGSGSRAKIDNENRLHTNSITRVEVNQAIFLGNGYNVNTGLVDVTNANIDNAIFYLKNNGAETIQGDAFQEVFQDESFTVQSTGTNYIVI